MKPLSHPEIMIIAAESGFDVEAHNPTSTAFGVGQLIEANRKKYAQQLGFKPETTDFVEQVAMFRSYVAERYRDAYEALKFRDAHGWY